MISDQSQKLFRITCNFGCGDLCFFMCVAEFCMLVILECNFGAAYRGVSSAGLYLRTLNPGSGGGML